MKAKIDYFSDEELRKMVAESTSMRELCRKLGYVATGSNHKTIKKKLKKRGISWEHFTGLPKNQIPRSPENIFIKDSTATQATLRRWYLKGNYSEYKCSVCGLPPFWNNQELTLTLDHINGCNTDDRLENLRWVCPNCDRQLKTFAGKNTKTKKEKKKHYCTICGAEVTREGCLCTTCAHKQQRKVDRPDRETLKEDIRTMSMTQVGKKYGVNDNSIRKWCDAYGLPRRVRDIKSYSDEEWKEI